jgi:hypothetical protein
MVRYLPRTDFQGFCILFHYRREFFISNFEKNIISTEHKGMHPDVQLLS